MRTESAVFNLKQVLEDFLQRAADQELKAFSVDRKLSLLEDIVYGKRKRFWRLYWRFVSFGDWLSQEGLKILENGFEPKQLERIIACVEKIKAYANRITDQKKKLLVKRALHLGNSFVREGVRKLGMEYTPLGLMESMPTEFREKLAQKMPMGGTVKDNYTKALDYQKEMLENFYKPGDHLLTILNHQITSLEKRPSLEDEVFTASLLYYLKQYDYKIAPYLERFKKITSGKVKK